MARQEEARRGGLPGRASKGVCLAADTPEDVLTPRDGQALRRSCELGLTLDRNRLPTCLASTIGGGSMSALLPIVDKLTKLIPRLDTDHHGEPLPPPTHKPASAEDDLSLAEMAFWLQNHAWGRLNSRGREFVYDMVVCTAWRRLIHRQARWLRSLPAWLWGCPS